MASSQRLLPCGGFTYVRDVRKGRSSTGASSTVQEALPSQIKVHISGSRMPTATKFSDVFVIAFQQHGLTLTLTSIQHLPMEDSAGATVLHGPVV